MKSRDADKTADVDWDAPVETDLVFDRRYPGGPRKVVGRRLVKPLPPVTPRAVKELKE